MGSIGGKDPKTLNLEPQPPNPIRPYRGGIIRGSCDESSAESPKTRAGELVESSDEDFASKGGRGFACDFSGGSLVTSQFGSLVTSCFLSSRNAELSWFSENRVTPKP